MATHGDQRAGEDRSPDYDSSNIQVLEGVEHVRLRPGMYIGTTSRPRPAPPRLRGRRQLVDEAMAGPRDQIIVTLHADGCGQRPRQRRAASRSSRSPSAKDRRPAVEVVLTTLHAGGKFGGGGYAISGGLHGVGVSVVNALSEKLTVEVMRDGQLVDADVRARQGRPRKLTKGKATHEDRDARSASGPTPRSSPRRVEFKREMLAERLQELAFLNKGVEIQLIDEREARPEQGGLQGVEAASPTS